VRLAKLDPPRAKAPNAQRHEGKTDSVKIWLKKGEEVAVVGGGNSAGQAAVFLAGRTRRVYLLLRSGDLGKSMSRYLVNRDMKAENVELLANTELRELLVEDRLDGNEYVRTAWTHAANFRSAGPFRLHRDSDTTGNALRQHIQQATWRTVEHVASHSAARSHGLRP
jgi:thioredoxin reductase